MRDDRSVAYAFGVAGLAYVVAGALLLDLEAAPLLALSLSFVVASTAALAVWPGPRPLTFVALWVLSIGLMGVYLAPADDAIFGDTAMALFVSAVFGTYAFLAWLAGGLAAWGVWRTIASFRQT